MINQKFLHDLTAEITCLGFKEKEILLYKFIKNKRVATERGA